VFAELQTTVWWLPILNTSLPGSRRSEFRAERRTGDVPGTNADPANAQAFGRVASFCARGISHANSQNRGELQS